MGLAFLRGRAVLLGDDARGGRDSDECCCSGTRGQRDRPTCRRGQDRVVFVSVRDARGRLERRCRLPCGQQGQGAPELWVAVDDGARYTG